MPIQDYWNNTITVSPTQVIGYRGDLADFPHDIYSFLLSTIREADQEYTAFIWRWLQPIQQFWESQYAAILNVIALKSPSLCPTDYLDYLRKDIGIMDDLSYVWGVMTEAEKRRFIENFVRFLRFRGTSFGIKEMLETMTGVPIEHQTFFYFRWIASGDLSTDIETAIGREDDGYDSWMISEENMPVGIQPDTVSHAVVGAFTYYTIKITQLVAELTNLPIPLFVYVKFLGTSVTVRGVVSESGGIYDTVLPPDEIFGQSPLSLSDVVENFRVSWEPDPLVSDVLIEDDGTLNTDMVPGLVRFSRPLSERVYIRYYLFIENFGTDDNWDTIIGTPVYSTGSVLLTDPALVETIQCNKTGSASWSDYSIHVKMKQGVVARYAIIKFMYQDANNHYYFMITPSVLPTIPAGVWELHRVVVGVDVMIATGNLDHLDIDVDYMWRIDCFVSVRPGPLDVQIIQLYQDECLLNTVVDNPAPWGGNAEGTIEISSENTGSVTVSRVLVHPIPMVSDYVSP